MCVCWLAGNDQVLIRFCQISPMYYLVMAVAQRFRLLSSAKFEFEFETKRGKARRTAASFVRASCMHCASTLLFPHLDSYSYYKKPKARLMILAVFNYVGGFR